MDERKNSLAIDSAAADWAAKEDRGALSEQDAEALSAWLASDPRCLGALLRARALYLRTEAASALGPGFDPDAFAVRREASVKPPVRRQRALYLTGAAAACIFMMGIAGSSLMAPQALATELGEVRLVPLDDGSSVMLNTLTRVKVRYSEASRSVRLLEGEVDFRIVPDAGREFIVTAGDSHIRTQGASFKVKRIEGRPLEVLVYQGEVQVYGKSGQEAARIDTNKQIVVPPGGVVPVSTKAVVDVPPEVVKRELAWRDGKIAFEGETLAAAAESFRRYSATPIIIEDPELAQETIAGLFAANDPAGFSRAIEDVFDVEATTRNGKIILERNKN